MSRHTLRRALGPLALAALVLPVAACSGDDPDPAAFCDSARDALEASSLNVETGEEFQAALADMAADIRDISAPSEIADEWNTFRDAVVGMEREVAATDGSDEAVQQALVDYNTDVDSDALADANDALSDYVTETCTE